MAITIRIEPIERDVAVMIADLQMAGAEGLRQFAQQEISDAKEINRRALGAVPPFKVFVDGQRDEDLSSVQARSTIVTEFQLVMDVLSFIGEHLVQESPFLTGRYEKSHKLFADGIEIDAESASALTTIADEYVFINDQPYSRKIERGASSEAPDGVYQVVATLARRRFGNIAKINFTYRPVLGGAIAAGRNNRNPAIVVKVR